MVLTKINLKQDLPTKTYKVLTRTGLEMTQNNLLQTAGYWLAQGIAVIPIGFLSKRPTVEWLPYTEQLPTGKELNTWFDSPMHNLGVVTGWQNLVVIDFDVLAQYHAWIKWCREVGGMAMIVMETTRIVRSARGAHVYVHTEQETENMKLPGIDILAKRKYVLAPPSVHPSGADYVAERDVLPARISAISDVLPAEWINDRIDSKTPQNASERVPKQLAIGSVVDPWEAAENPDAGFVKNTLIMDIRARFRIEDFFPDRESTDHNRGRWYIARCPLHNDRNPSMSIDTLNQVCSCRAGCNGGRPLDVINLFARMKGISNAEAIGRLRLMISARSSHG